MADGERLKAIQDIGRGLVDADRGGGGVKRRIARTGGGKSGGFRTIILLKAGEQAFFVRGFAKNDLGNIRDDDCRVEAGPMDKQTMRQVSQWERGEKHPQGASFRLLSLVAEKGSEMVA